MISRLSPTANRKIDAAIFVVACIAIGIWIPRQMTLNPTPSLPNTLYLLRKAPQDIERRDIVRFPRSDKMTGGSVHLLKRVGCMSGDILQVNADKEYWCNGQYLGRAKDRSLKGERLQHFEWNGPVPAGKFFALADHKDSYDSRYFGFVDLSLVEAKAYPLF